MIDLNECKGVTEKGEDNEFEIKTRGGKFNLRSDSQRARDEWITAMRAAITNSLSKVEFQENYKAVLYRGARFVKYHNDAMGRFNLLNKVRRERRFRERVQ